MDGAGHSTTSQDSLKLASRFQSLHFERAPQELFSYALRRPLKSDGQTFATLGAAGVDYGPAATSLHAYQEAVSTGAANLGRLVSAFHIENPKVINDSPPPILQQVTVLSCPTKAG
jgi:hypothetical protein